MDNSSFNPGSFRGFLFTSLLYVFSKISAGYMLFAYIKISDVASMATIVSGMVVVIVNVPKVINVYDKYIKTLWKRK